MKILFKIIVGFLAVIGSITIALAAFLYLADPLGLKDLFRQSSTLPISNEPVSGSGNYNLSPAQKFFLKKAGIDPNSLPTTISPEMELCLTNAVDEERAAAIKAGEVPTVTDLLKAKTCLNN